MPPVYSFEMNVFDGLHRLAQTALSQLQQTVQCLKFCKDSGQKLSVARPHPLRHSRLAVDAAASLE